jgi:hypothetical protein
VVNRLLAGLSLLGAASTAACVGGDIPPRPAVQQSGVDGGPEPIELATGSGCGRAHLVVADGVVYWTERDTGTVKSVPAAGGPTKVIAAGQSKPGALAVDGASIFWVAGGGRTIMTKPLTTGAATVFVKATSFPEPLGGENDVNALLIDRGDLFFGRYTYSFKVPAAGGTPLVIGHSPDGDDGQPGAFAVDDTHLYQTEIGHHAVTRERRDGTQEGYLEGRVMTSKLAPDRIAISQKPLLEDAIAVAGGNVYWGKAGTIQGEPVDGIESAGSVVVASSAGMNAITGFVLSDDAVYFGEAVSNTVQRAPLATGVVEVVATGQLSPRQFAADAGSVYWHTDDCRIMKLPK